MRGKHQYWLGKTRPQETRDKISRTKKNDPNTPKPMLGKHHPPDVKRKLREAKLGKPNWTEKRAAAMRALRGPIHWNWKGGYSKIDRPIRQLKRYYQWRSDVFQRDGWRCRTCGVGGVYVVAHHIKGFSVILKEYNIRNTDDAMGCAELWDVNNGITLCESCHQLTSNYKRKNKEKQKWP